MNIASLDEHIHDFKCPISILDHDFDVLGINENKIRNTGSISKPNNDGYNFEYTPTKHLCEGTSLYILEMRISTRKIMNIVFLWMALLSLFL